MRQAVICEVWHPPTKGPRFPRLESSVISPLLAPPPPVLPLKDGGTSPPAVISIPPLPTQHRAIPGQAHGPSCRACLSRLSGFSPLPGGCLSRWPSRQRPRGSEPAGPGAALSLGHPRPGATPCPITACCGTDVCGGVLLRAQQGLAWASFRLWLGSPCG